LDLELTQALTNADNTEDVLRVLLNHVGGETMDPRTVRDAVSTGLKLQASPMARLVDPANLKVVKFVEKVDRVFGRQYVRGSVLSLGNGTELLNGQRDIFKATTNQERGAAVVNGVDKIVDAIGTDLALDAKLIDDLKKVTKISGKERALQNAYSLDKALNGSNPHPLL